MLPTGITRYILFGVGALLLIAAIVLGVKGCKEIDQENRNQLVNSGEIIEREKGQAEAINAIQNANNAVERPTPEQLNVVCNKYDRNCKDGA